ncbi:MAG: hypothetical protein JWN44_3518 [Myxococcales bacterium]|nr:hypothetical protein [Myxococcales bacterium]
MSNPLSAARALRSLVLSYVPQRVRTFQTLLYVVLVANAVDLSTSWLPTFFDTVELTRPSRAMTALQLTLLAPLLWSARRWPWRRLARLWADLPIPFASRAILSAIVFMQLVHVAFRMESYPFSSVAMFSNVVEIPATGSYRNNSYVICRDNQVELVRMLREANPYFARHFDWDYKAGWLLRMYKGTPAADAVMAEAARSAGIPAPTMATITYDAGSGRVRSLVPWKRP